MLSASGAKRLSAITASALAFVLWPLAALSTEAAEPSPSASTSAESTAAPAPQPTIQTSHGEATVWGDVVSGEMGAKSEDASADQGSSRTSTGDAANVANEALAALMNSTYNSNLPVCNYFQISLVAFTERCIEATAQPTASPIPGAPGVTYDQARNVVINLIARLEIPDPQIQIGPEPSLNEWNMAVVGMPYWLWTTEATSKSTTVSIANYSISMAARRESVTFDPGDGTASITCTTMQPWTRDNLMQTAPGCGHTYSQRNEKGTNFTLRARARWIIDWTALGYTGTLRMQTTATRDVHVGELQSVVVAVGNKAR